MGHKADKSFFNEKRHWSKRKDRILEYLSYKDKRLIAALRLERK